jgi:nitrate/nitrite-specific signal transduction histidine kinase
MNGHLGLQTMREHADSSADSLLITPSPGPGATVHVRLVFA